MTTATRSIPESFAEYSPPQQSTGPIVVASDMSRQSDAAFPVAKALATRSDADVHVVSVIMPFAMPMYAFDAVPVPLDADDTARESRTEELKEQSGRLASSTWTTTVRVGEPASEIVEFAQSVNARVIVVGRGRHAALQRALGGETVLRLLQLGDTPVLATESKLTGLPSRVVVATDFSDFSLRAAQVALPLVAPNATVYLAHVVPTVSPADEGLRERAVTYRHQANQAFSQLRERLTRDGMQFEEVLAEGDPSEELIKVVQAKDADLVVTATHGYGFLRRMILGSVAAELVRHAPCSVLCVPGSRHTQRGARMRSSSRTVTHSFDLATLDAELNAFSERNEGRRVSIELDHADLGAQVLGHSLPLVGATYDHPAGMVLLMLGASGFRGEHLTHAIPDVSAVDLSVDGEGRDQALRVTHPRGQTLLLLE